MLAPLPNHLFTRDTSCWIYGGVSLNPMAKPARRRETVHLEAIYRFHPRFARRGLRRSGTAASTRTGAARRSRAATCSCIGDGAVLIGMGERTTPVRGRAARAAAVRAAARRGEVLAVELPRARSYMHLDTVMTMIDRDAFVMYPGVIDDARDVVDHAGRRARRARGHRRGRSCSTRSRTALGLDEVRVFTTGGDEMEADREQWDDGNNVLAVEPGVVVALRPQRRHEHEAAAGRASKSSRSRASSSRAVVAARAA